MAVTLSMTPAGGTTNWYLRTSEDAITWRYFSGPVVTGASGAAYLTEVASAAAAEAAAVAHTTLGNPSASAVNFPVPVSARYVDLWFRNTTHSTRVDEFYPRRLVQTDDLEAEAVKARHIAADAVLANHVNATSFVGFEFTGVIITGSTIQTAASGERVVLDATGIKTYDAGGAVQVEATTATDGELRAGGGNVRLYDEGQRFIARTTAAWPTLSPASNSIAWLNGSSQAIGFIEGVTQVDEATTPILLISTAGLADSQVIAAAESVVSLVNLSGAGRLDVFDTEVRVTENLVVTGGDASIQQGLNVGSAAGAGTGQIRASGSLTVTNQIRPNGIGARVYNSAAISIPNNTATVLTFNSESYDTDSFHSTSSNTDRLTVPFAGQYLVGGNVYWVAATGGRRVLEILLNGTVIATTEIGSPAVNTSAPQQVVTMPYMLGAGDVLQLRVYQDSGASLNVGRANDYSPMFWIARLA